MGVFYPTAFPFYPTAFPPPPLETAPVFHAQSAPVFHAAGFSLAQNGLSKEIFGIVLEDVPPLERIRRRPGIRMRRKGCGRLAKQSP